MSEPSNYSFIDDFVAGSAQPYEKENLDAYSKDGIVDIISLTPKKPLVSKYADDKFTFHHFPVYSIPDDGQLEEFIDLLEQMKNEDKKVVIHCEYGQERTGIFLATYLVELKDYSVKEAIKEIRSLRPSSLRTPSAVQFLLDRYE